MHTNKNGNSLSPDTDTDTQPQLINSSNITKLVPFATPLSRIDTNSFPS